MHPYQFEELLAAAMKFDSSVEDRLALMEWLDYYDPQSFNGECYHLENGRSLYPVTEEDGDGNFNYIDATIW